MSMKVSIKRPCFALSVQSRSSMSVMNSVADRITQGPVFAGGKTQRDKPSISSTSSNSLPVDASGHFLFGQDRLRKSMEKKAKPSPEMQLYLKSNQIGKPMGRGARRAMWYTMTQGGYAPLFCDLLRPKLRLLGKATSEAELPLPQLPEVALIGRSNCGKSTLLNSMGGTRYAFVKKTPGSTQELTFWKVGKPSKLCLVDLPGYGYAMANEENRVKWTEFTLWYLKNRRNLRLVLFLLDACHGLKDSDREMISFFERYKIPWQIMLTKTDKVPAKELSQRIHTMNSIDLEMDLATGKSKRYSTMQGPMTPCSGLRRQNLETVRSIVERHALPHTVVVNGIQQKCYDLMEVHRLKKEEKRQKKSGKLKDSIEQSKADIKKKKLSSTLASWGLDQGILDGEDSAGDGDADSFYQSDTDAFDTDAQFDDDSGSKSRSSGTRFEGSEGNDKPDHGFSSSRDNWAGDNGLDTSTSARLHEKSARAGGSSMDHETQDEKPSGMISFDLRAPRRRPKAGKPKQSEPQPVMLDSSRSENAKGDRQLEEAEVLTDEDRASAWRPGKQDFDVKNGDGKTLKTMYSREWRGALEDPNGTPAIPTNAQTRADSQSAENRSPYAERRTKARAKSETIGLYSPELGEEIPKGIHKWRYLGKPQRKVSHLDSVRDIARVMKARSRETKESGNAMTWERAKTKWVAWAQKNRMRPGLVAQAESPRLKDTEEAFEEKHKVRLSDLPESESRKTCPIRNKEVQRGKKQLQFEAKKRSKIQHRLSSA